MGSSSDDLRKVFEIFDADGSGAIDSSELTAKIHELGFMVDAEELSQMLKDADENGNGVIEFKEFERLMTLPQYEGFGARILSIHALHLTSAGAPSADGAKQRSRSRSRSRSRAAPLSVPAPRAEELLAVGTYTEPAGHILAKELGKGIYTFRADAEGVLTPTGAPPLELRNPSYIVRHPSKPLLYATLETTSWDGVDETSAVAAVKFDPSTGELTLLNIQPVAGGAACHASTDGEFVYVACYLAQEGCGRVHMLPIGANGSIEPPCDSARLSDAAGEAGDKARGGWQAGRQDTSHPHMACLHRAEGGLELLVPDLGAGALYCFSVDTVSRKMSHKATAKFDIGSGPRHCVVHSKGNVAFVTCELTSMVSVVDLASMTILQSVSTLPDGVEPAGCNSMTSSMTSAIKLSPDDSTLYVSNRGHDSIVCIEVSGTAIRQGRQSARLGTRTWCKTGGNTPRDFFIGQNGRYALALHQDSGTIAQLKVEESSLTASGVQYPVPASVVMIALGEAQTNGD